MTPWDFSRSGRAGGQRLVTGSVAWLVLGIAFAGQGCRLAKSAAQLPAQTVRLAMPGGKADARTDPVELQRLLLGLADDFATRMVVGIDRLSRDGSPLPREESLRYKLAAASKIYAIASEIQGPAALVELTVLAAATRRALESDAQAEAFGNSAMDLIDHCRSVESNLWHAAGQTLQPNHITELRDVLTRSLVRGLSLQDVMVTRTEGGAALLIETSKENATRPESVFSLLRIDPLAGVDPAVREIARTRLLAERALFFVQRLPRLLRWQTELLAIHTSEIPAVKQLVANSSALSSSVDRFVLVAEQLPAQWAREREEILNALESQESRLVPLAQEVRQTLGAGAEMSMELNRAMVTFDALLKRFGVGESNAAPSEATGPPSEPFRILDYGQTASQIEGAASQLRDLISDVDQLLGSPHLARLPEQVGPALNQAQASGRELVDYAFARGLCLVAVSFLAAVAYRFLSARIQAKSRPGILS